MQTLNVLVVDDEFGMRSGIERALRTFSVDFNEFNESVRYCVKTVDNGDDALNILQLSETDILILDHQLPDITGLEILDFIKKENVNVLTIMITAFASLEVAISATRNGAFDFLAKPFTPDDLKTRIKNASERIFLQRKAEKLEKEKNAVRFQFISVLGHELKAPLSAIEGYMFLMQKKTAGENMTNYQSMIDRSIIRLDGMRKMISDLLDLTRIESGNKRREMVEFNFDELLEYCVENVQVDATKRNIDLNVTCPGNFKIKADRDELQMVINNLLTNSVKYNKDGGKVDFSVYGDEYHFVMKCVDTGIGMTEGEQKKLFQEFSRVKNSKTRDITGSGLGLSILKKIITNYQGNVKVDSEKDNGTTFTIKLKRFNDE
ncbi:MAG: hybrid sensor histidine kinase/response regulator [Bacteriovoracaceae bacterium]|nr:hybrid sensor histidine kinase/response regulator [Bacteriovoracaceae bacterium]